MPLLRLMGLIIARPIAMHKPTGKVPSHRTLTRLPAGRAWVA